MPKHRPLPPSKAVSGQRPANALSLGVLLPSPLSSIPFYRSTYHAWKNVVYSVRADRPDWLTGRIPKRKNTIHNYIIIATIIQPYKGRIVYVCACVDVCVRVCMCVYVYYNKVSGVRVMCPMRGKKKGTRIRRKKNVGPRLVERPTVNGVRFSFFFPSEPRHIKVKRTQLFDREPRAR